MSNKVDPVLVLQARAEARALLWLEGYFDLAEAVDALQHGAVELGLIDRLGQDQVQRIIANTFAPVRDDDTKSDSGPCSVAQSTLDAAAWLWFGCGESKRFSAWLADYSDRDRAVILQHIKDLKAQRHARNERRG